MANFNLDGKYLKDGNSVVAEIDNSFIRDKNSKRIAEFNETYIRKISGEIIAQIDGSYVKDNHGKIITTIDDIKNDIDDAEDSALVALWMLFIKK
ncbi:hypothetical protein KC725_04525 [Candidatus Peregrinibacteria bacterium]|nr:hypothetical protein [Candidatus Peregrinibacteria bacterium]